MEERSGSAALPSAHRLGMHRVYHVVRSVGGKRYVALVQRYNREETAHIKMPSEKPLKMKTDQENLFENRFE